MSLRERVVRRSVTWIVAVLLAVGLSGCRSQPSITRSPVYRLFFSVQGDGTHEARGTLKGDYEWAAISDTQEEALARWREVVSRHLPPNGEYQDGFQRNYVRAAEYELMRLEYLSGNIDRGDELLRRLQDVQ